MSVLFYMSVTNSEMRMSRIIDPSMVLLQATQGDVVSQVQQNALLSSSLWINIALAGASILLFIYMGRSITSGRARLIWGATLMIPLVSISSYLGLASGLTVGVIEMPAGHALAGEEVLSQWGRYLTWALSTPMILLALGVLADVDRGSLFTVIAADIGMCVTGLAAALTTSSYLFRWIFFGVSSAFFVVVLYALLTEWAASALREQARYLVPFVSSLSCFGLDTPSSGHSVSKASQLSSLLDLPLGDTLHLTL